MITNMPRLYFSDHSACSVGLLFLFIKLPLPNAIRLNSRNSSEVISYATANVLAGMPPPRIDLILTETSSSSASLLW